MVKLAMICIAIGLLAGSASGGGLVNASKAIRDRIPMASSLSHSLIANLELAANSPFGQSE